MMRMTNEGSLRARQWGRAGPIMALVSVLIVAALAKVTLAQFGLTPQAKPAVASATTGQRAPGPDGAPVEEDEEPANAQPPTALNSIDKARAVQGIVQRQAEELAARIEAEGK
jgi:hypothetical protein